MTDNQQAIGAEVGRASERLHILQHSLGVDEFGQGNQYRNRFVTGAGSDDYDDCIELVSSGLMTRRDGETLPFGGMDLFHVTDAGKAFVAEHSPKPPKLTASQKRYRAWLDADGGLPFGEFLKRGRSLAQSQEVL